MRNFICVVTVTTFAAVFVAGFAMAWHGLNHPGADGSVGAGVPAGFLWSIIMGLGLLVSFGISMDYLSRNRP